jgi:hypothetical protein
MPRRHRFAKLALLATLVQAGAACEGKPYEPGDYATMKSVDVAALNGSGLTGQVFLWTKPAHFTGELSFGGVGRTDVGARYPMHIHAGGTCVGGALAIVHDLGAPMSSIKPGDPSGVPSVVLSDYTVPSEHMASGYYLDVHASNDPIGTPLGCALFAFATVVVG